MQIKSLFLFVTLILITTGCEETIVEPISSSSLTCRGTYYERINGELKKYNQYEQGGRCLTDNQPLSQWEKSDEAFIKNKVQCVPQPNFESRSVVAANNYYFVRDGNVYIDFSSTTGVYRRIILGEDNQGNPTFTRSKGCFYQRIATGVDLAFGKQILLDTNIEKWASSEYFETMEIFKYDETATELNMIRFDSSSDWTAYFCPFQSVPEDIFCKLLQNGNIFFHPVLTAQEQNDLLNEALLIGKQFNYVTTSKSQFENLWDNVEKSRKEIGRDDWKYKVIHTADVPQFVHSAWRDFVMGNRSLMPQISSPMLPEVCYGGSQQITLTNGNTAKIYGEICYSAIDGYTFRPD